MIKLYTPKPSSYDYAPVLSFNFGDADSVTTAQILSENGVAVRGGLHCAPEAHRYLDTKDTGTVRLSPCAFNTGGEVSAFLKLINGEKFIKKL